MAQTDLSADPGAERRQITVMFCDMVGSSQLAASLDPEDFSALLVDYRKTVAGHVERWGGFVSRYVGDGVLAYWGYPRAHGDDARRALAAALDISAAFSGGADGAVTGVRVGLDTGIVVIGQLGAAGTQAADIVGDAPNIAAQLQAGGAAGDVLVTATLRDLAGSAFDFAPAGRRRLKSRREPVAVFRVRPPRERSPRAGPKLRLIGRDGELAILRAAMAQACEGRGSAATVVGEPGMGKTALIAQLREEARAAAVPWLDCVCSELGRSSAMLPLRDMLLRALEIDPHDPPAARAAAVRRRLQATLQDAAKIEALIAWLGVGAAPGAREAPSAELRRLGFAALCEWLASLAQASGAVVAAENVHWADAAAAEALRRLAQIAAGSNLLFVQTSRDRSPWPGAPAASVEIQLQPLDGAATAALVARLDQQGRLSPQARSTAVARAEGIPFFAVELVKLAQTADAQTLADVLSRPSTLNDSLAARLDALGPLRPIAQAASVLGDRLDEAVLAHMLSLDASELRARLAAMAAAGFIEASDDLLVGDHVFRHRLLREAAYNSLLRARRRDLHARAADILTNVFPDRAEARPDLAARHFGEAGASLDASFWWRVAGDRAAAQTATLDAIDCYRRACEALPRPAEGRAAVLEAQARIGLATQFAARDGYGAAAVGEELALAAAAAESAHEQGADALFHALCLLFSHETLGGSAGPRGPLGDRLAQLADARGDAGMRLQARRLRGLDALLVGRFAAASAEYDVALDCVPALAVGDGRLSMAGSDSGVMTTLEAALTAALRGRMSRAAGLLETGLARVRSLAHPATSAQAICLAATLAWARDEPARARVLAQEARALAQAQAVIPFVAWAGALIGWARACGGDAGGLEDCRHAMAISQSSGARQIGAFCQLLWGDGETRLRRPADALEKFDAALTLGAAIGAHGLDAEIVRRKALALLALGADAQADALLQAAAALARTQGATLFELRCEIERRRRGAPAEMLRGCLARLADEPDFPEMIAARRLL
ncbi:MAG: AAA family ATPase [Rhizobiales bacterium]|nr:AAA family ATPase [Hyphomicrobiales bacterium]